MKRIIRVEFDNTLDAADAIRELKSKGIQPQDILMAVSHNEIPERGEKGGEVQFNDTISPTSGLKTGAMAIFTGDFYVFATASRPLQSITRQRPAGRRRRLRIPFASRNCCNLRGFVNKFPHTKHALFTKRCNPFGSFIY